MTIHTLFRIGLALLLSICLIPAIAAPRNISASIPITGTANDARIDEFDRQFVQLLERWRMRGGASVTIMKNGQVIAQRGYGWANQARQQPVYPDSLFRVASISKTFTAVTILQLAQQGKLDLNARVFDILSDLKPLGNRGVNPQIYQITVWNLLQMSSGWFSGANGHFDPMFGPWPKSVEALLSPELPASCETTARFMMTMPLRYQPGTHFAYSNLDYCILGLVINKVTGSRYGYAGYQNYVQNNLLAPLGIGDMFIGSTQLKYRQPNEVTYYGGAAANAKELANSFYFPYSTTEILKKNFANGGWVATSKDLATFVQALYQGQILNRRSLQLMQSKPAFIAPPPTHADPPPAPKKKGKHKAVPATPPEEPAEKVESYYTMGGIIYWLNDKAYWIQTGSFTGTNALIVTKPNGTTIAVIFNYRPDAYSFLKRFRPELRRLLINCDF